MMEKNIYYHGSSVIFDSFNLDSLAESSGCKFGAGVYHNGSVGSSPNPFGNDLGFTIGSYGKGYGKKQAWGYYDENGDLVITRGTPASMPLYNAAQEVMRKAVEIAKEVFG